MERAHDHRPPYHEFAIELERARREAGLKSKDLAEQLFVGPRTVRRYLNGERLPTLETTERWEQACGIEPGRLTSIHPEGAQFRPHLIEGGDAAVGDAARPRFPRRWAALIALVAVAAGAVAVGVSLQGGPSKTKLEQTVERAKSLRSTYPEKTGGTARTWSDYTNAGGDPGPTINGSREVEVTCRIRGFEVESGNQWWYLVASAPWRNNYFATADAFFNQRRTQGVDFKKTRFVDPGVPLCP